MQAKRWLAGAVVVALIAGAGWRLSETPSVACRLGRDDACAAMAESLAAEGDTTSAYAMFAQLCEAGRASACLTAGRMDWAARRPSEAITMWQKGCDAQPPSGDPDAEVPCAPILWARADTACRAGDASACPTRDLLGLKHQLIDPTPACANLLPRCRAGEEEVCAVIGWRCR